MLFILAVLLVFSGILWYPLLLWRTEIHYMDVGPDTAFPKEYNVTPYYGTYLASAIASWSGGPGPVAFIYTDHSGWVAHEHGNFTKIPWYVNVDLSIQYAAKYREYSYATYIKKLRARKDLVGSSKTATKPWARLR